MPVLISIDCEEVSLFGEICIYVVLPSLSSLDHQSRLFKPFFVYMLVAPIPRSVGAFVLVRACFVFWWELWCFFDKKMTRWCDLWSILWFCDVFVIHMMCFICLYVLELFLRSTLRSVRMISWKASKKRSDPQPFPQLFRYLWCVLYLWCVFVICSFIYDVFYDFYDVFYDVFSGHHIRITWSGHLFRVEIEREYEGNWNWWSDFDSCYCEQKWGISYDIWCVLWCVFLFMMCFMIHLWYMMWCVRSIWAISLKNSQMIRRFQRDKRSRNGFLMIQVYIGDLWSFLWCIWCVCDPVMMFMMCLWSIYDVNDVFVIHLWC